MKDQHIVCFLAAARTQNISLAAQELHMSQQAVSRSLRLLEEELGFALLHRRNDGIQLTETGRRYFELFHDFSRRLHEAASFSVSEPNLVRIGWGDWTGCPEPLLARMRACAAAEPAVRFRLLVGPIADILDGPDLDIVLATEQIPIPPAAQARVRTVSRLPIFLVRGRNAPDESGGRRLPHLESLDLERDRDAAARRIRRRYELLGLPPRPIELLPNLASVFAQVQLGAGVCFSPPNEFIRDTQRFAAQPLDWTLRLCALLRENASAAAADFWSQLEEAQP